MSVDQCPDCGFMVDTDTHDCDGSEDEEKIKQQYHDMFGDDPEDMFGRNWLTKIKELNSH